MTEVGPTDKPTTDEALRKGDVVRFWPGARSGIGHLSVCERDQSVLSGHTPGVYLRRSDRDNHMDFIALTHVDLVRRCAPIGGGQRDNE